MKIAQRKSVNLAVQRRELLLRERNRSAALRGAYPDVAQLQIELIFTDQSNHTPSPQRHILYPPAPAFFRFACPCADCDADFDLMPFVVELLDAASGRCKQPTTAAGHVSCHGVRLRDRLGSTACSMQLKFQLVAVRTHSDRATDRRLTATG
jgi:hypothetical protein